MPPIFERVFIMTKEAERHEQDKRYAALKFIQKLHKDGEISKDLYEHILNKERKGLDIADFM